MSPPFVTADAAPPLEPGDAVRVVTGKYAGSSGVFKRWPKTADACKAWIAIEVEAERVEVCLFTRSFVRCLTDPLGCSPPAGSSTGRTTAPAVAEASTVPQGLEASPSRPSASTVEPASSAQEAQHAPVEVVRGVYRGQAALLLRLTNQKAFVRLDNGQEKCLSRSSIQVPALPDAPQCSTSGAEFGEDIRTSSLLAPVGDHVGSAGLLHVLSAHYPEWNLTPRRLQTLGATSALWFEGIWDSQGNTVTVQKPKPSAEVNFLAMRFPARLLTVTPAQGSEKAVPTKQLEHCGVHFELVCTKWSEDGRNLRRYYLATDGAGLPALSPSVAEALQGVADFAGVPLVVKRWARLQLLVTPVPRACLLRMHAAAFEVIDDVISSVTGQTMTDGCGFVPEAVLQDIVQRCGRRSASGGGGGEGAAAPCAMQIRVYCPQLGVFKGMLLAKPGIERIQLRRSMLKVAASPTWRGAATPSEADETATLAVKRMFPSGGGGGGEWARFGRRKARLSPMLLRLWGALGMPLELQESYQQATGAGHGEHAWLVGVCDPFHALPEGTLYAPGVPATEAFITRFPCVKPADGRRLPLVAANALPAALTPAQQAWMRQLPRGVVVFSSRGTRSLPASIADGDLDGDLYFCCWNQAVLASVRLHTASGPAAPPEPAVAAPPTPTAGERIVQTVVRALSGQLFRPLVQQRGAAPPAAPSSPVTQAFAGGDEGRAESGAPSTSGGHSTDGWFEALQAHLADPEVVKQQAHISKFYRAWDRLAAERAEGLNDPDVLALGGAYVNALNSKHGETQRLPPHLYDYVFKRT